MTRRPNCPRRGTGTRLQQAHIGPKSAPGGSNKSSCAATVVVMVVVMIMFMVKAEWCMVKDDDKNDYDDE